MAAKPAKIVTNHKELFSAAFHHFVKFRAFCNCAFSTFPENISRSQQTCNENPA